MNEHLSGSFKFNHFEDTVLHLANSLIFSESHATLVTDVINTTFAFCMLSACATNLKIVSGSNFFQLLKIRCQFWQSDVYTGSDGCAQVGWTESQEAKTIITWKWNFWFNCSDGLNANKVLVIIFLSTVFTATPDYVLRFILLYLNLRRECILRQSQVTV